MNGSLPGALRPPNSQEPAQVGATTATPDEGPSPTGAEPPKVSDQLEGWLTSAGDKTLGSLVGVFEEKSFAILFVLLLGLPALPIPTGGATHAFEVIAVLLALQLIAGRNEIWLPRRWRQKPLVGDKSRKFVASLMKMIRRLEKISRPRLRFLFNHRLTNIIFGLLVIGGSTAAFFAPPFTGLDTLPALGVVLLSLAVLLEDILVAIVALVVGVAGVLLTLFLGAAALDGLQKLF